MISQPWSLSFLALQYLQLPTSPFCFINISSVLIYFLFMLFILPTPFFVPHQDWDGRRGLQRGVHVGSLGISISYPDWGFNYAPVISAGRELFEHKEMALPNFWKEN